MHFPPVFSFPLFNFSNHERSRCRGGRRAVLRVSSMMEKFTASSSAAAPDFAEREPLAALS